MQIGSTEALKAQMEKCIVSDCKDCPYTDTQICDTAMTKDALEYIESLEERIAIMQESMAALEKRNEPVSPICSQEIFGTFLVCGNCGEKLENVLEAESIDGLPIKWRYCRKCGRAVKWE